MTQYRHIPLLLIAGALSFSSVAMAHTGCAAKKEILQEKIRIAESHGNHRQAGGLRRALNEVVANCTDEGLRREREQAVEQAREKVTEREAELAREISEGDSERKIAKRRAKLEQAKSDLAEAEAELSR